MKSAIFHLKRELGKKALQFSEHADAVILSCWNIALWKEKKAITTHSLNALSMNTSAKSELLHMYFNNIMYGFREDIYVIPEDIHNQSE